MQGQDCLAGEGFTLSSPGHEVPTPYLKHQLSLTNQKDIYPHPLEIKAMDKAGHGGARL